MAHSEASDARLAAFGEQLIGVHDWLRSELARLSDEVDDHLSGGAPPKRLHAHCLSFCTALERHHTGEDDGAFPTLAAEFPELAPVLEKLREDHQLISGIMHRLRELVENPDPSRVRGELDGLMAIMESHFGYEERTIVNALNTLKSTDWSKEKPAFLRTDPPG